MSPCSNWVHNSLGALELRILYIDHIDLSTHGSVLANDEPCDLSYLVQR